MPDDRVSPTPRSKIRARIASSPVSHQKETLVRFGNRGSCSISGPIAGRSSRSSSSTVATRIAHCGLPTSIWRNAQPATAPVPTTRAVPMSTRHVVSERIVGRIGPAAVWIENSSASVAPERRR